MDALNKSARSGLYSTIGRNAKMPEEDEDENEEDEEEEESQKMPHATSRKSLASGLQKAWLFFLEVINSGAFFFQPGLVIGISPMPNG